MREYGVVFPGPYPQPHLEPLGFRPRRGAPPVGPQVWDRLLRDIADPSAARVLLSHEVLGRADDEQIRRVVDAVGGERPHVLTVARRYDALLPSQWQQRVKARQTRTYEEWLRLVLSDERRGRVWRNVWVPHDTSRLVERWGNVVGLDNVTLLIGDEADRARLPRAIEQMLALPPGLLDQATPRRNRSLTYGEAELLRQVTLAFERADATAEEFFEVHRMGMIRHLVSLPPPRGETPLPTLPEWAWEVVRRRSDERIAGLEDLRERGLRIVGDPSDLAFREPTDATDPTPPTSISIEAAVAAVDGLLHGARRLRDRAR